VIDREVVRRYLRQRLEAGDSELFLDALDHESARALLRTSPPTRAGGPAGGRVGLLEALAAEAPGIVAERGGPRTGQGAAGYAGDATRMPAPKGNAPLTAAPAATSALEILGAEVAGCTACGLHQERNRVVFGEGRATAEVVIVGEAPGREEDRSGRPFVGPAGKLLDLLLLSAGFPREEVYICNVIKCRPPGNRDPSSVEVEACSSHLRRQLDLIQPTVLLALGKFAAQTLAGSEESIGDLRGGVHEYHGIPLVVTYHPAFLLRSRSWVRAAWRDFQLLREVLETRRAG
jgi:DNA polymerase